MESDRLYQRRSSVYRRLNYRINNTDARSQDMIPTNSGVLVSEGWNKSISQW